MYSALEKRHIIIKDKEGKVVNDCGLVDIPSSWSDIAGKILADKYLVKTGIHENIIRSWHPQYAPAPELKDSNINNSGRENSAVQVAYRLAKHWTDAMLATGVDLSFLNDTGMDTIEYIMSLILNQRGAPNSPQFFNAGRGPVYKMKGNASGTFYIDDNGEGDIKKCRNAYTHPQVHACFILGMIKDSLFEPEKEECHCEDDGCEHSEEPEDEPKPTDGQSIMDTICTEVRIFKFGSGSGINYSNIRGKGEPLSGGGVSSGLISYIKMFDRNAGSIKSGGTTRRAARMVVLNADHPDIVEFVSWKAREEDKALALIKQGYDSSYEGEAYETVSGQNANNSVRVSDEFMELVTNDDPNAVWNLTNRVDNKKTPIKAKDLWYEIGKAAHRCGDPGLQFDDTINKWHTCLASGRINASNPCVTGDTLVSTKDGYCRIDSLLDNPFFVVNMNGTFTRVNPAFKTGHKPVYRLKTKSGFEVKCTEDHKIYTSNRGDVKACKLVKGDKIALGKMSFGTNTMDCRLAEYLGLLMGDGCLASGTLHLTMSKEEKPILDDIVQGVNSYKQQFSKSNGGKAKVNVCEAATTMKFTTCSKCVVEEIEKWAILDEYSHGKEFKDDVFTLNEASVAAILRGLFTADGTVANYGSKSNYVSLDSTSLKMLKQVQLLLLPFGIKGKIYENRRAGKTKAIMPDGKGNVKEMYSLRITCKSRVVFQEKIGFHPASDKTLRLANLNATIGTRTEKFDDEFLSFEYLGEEDVYDLTEPLTSHFVANGVVVHNCSEYLSLDNTACNLASINLMKYFNGTSFDVSTFKQDVKLWTIILDHSVNIGSYPTYNIAVNTRDYRNLGLGYANLGAILMCLGLPYDSEHARCVAAATTSLMTAIAYRMSAELARDLGPFPGYDMNKVHMQNVIDMHCNAHENLISMYERKDNDLFGDDLYVAEGIFNEILYEAKKEWNIVKKIGSEYGFRNSQVTLLAPTGTIGLLMDCSTTGIEPDFSIVKHKLLSGGGYMKIINESVSIALNNLGYSPAEIKVITSDITNNGYLTKMNPLKPEHYNIFATAMDCGEIKAIAPEGHVKMMAAVQPFLSGAISKTVNMPNNCTVEDILNMYALAWKLGVKAIAVYRDGCKSSQPLSTKKEDTEEVKQPVTAKSTPVRTAITTRRKLGSERPGCIISSKIANQKIVLVTGEYPDGSLGEIFIDMYKQGSPFKGMLDSFAIAVSLGLQHGVPIQEYIDRFVLTVFQPSGMCDHPNVKSCTSPIDFIFRVLALKYKNQTELCHVPPSLADNLPVSPPALMESKSRYASDAPMCTKCGHNMVRNGTCYKCVNCGETSGCS